MANIASIRPFETAVKLDGDARKNEIVARLNDYLDDDLLSICREAFSWDGSFEELYAFDAEDIENHVDPREIYRLMCQIVYGNVQTVNELLRFDAYGNLESISEFDLGIEARDRIDDIAEWLLDNWHHCDNLYEDDYNLFSAWDEVDQGIFEAQA